MVFSQEDELYMKRALKLAARGIGRTSPNPMVGAVLVKDGRIIGEGYHHYFGGDHAEIDALKHAVEEVTGTTMYVTLEPCHHYGKTPPCVDAVIAHRLAKVVVGMVDPDPRTAGKSVAKMRDHGIDVVTGVQEEACRKLNLAYVHHRTTGLPLVTLKFAQSLDGRIATVTGNSAWISSPLSRKLAHRLRARNDAVLTGAGTILADNPALTVRHVRGRNPLRVIVDATLKTPFDATVFIDRQAPTLVATTSYADLEKVKSLREHGIEVLELTAVENGMVDLEALLKVLGERDVTSLLVEGGSKIITSFIKQNLADRFTAIVAPLIIGKGIETVGDLGIKEISRAVTLEFDKVSRSGPDIVIEGKFSR